MRTTYWEYYHPSKAEIEAMKDTWIYVFDACSLAELYAFPTTQRNKILKRMKTLSREGRVFLTHQNGKEYHQIRKLKLDELLNCFDEAEKVLNGLKSGYTTNNKVVLPFRRHSRIDKDSIQRNLFKIGENAINKEIRSLQQKKRTYKDFRDQDPIRDALEGIFANKIGPEYSEDDYEIKSQMAQNRKNKKKFPWLLDSGIGDIISWFQLIDFAKTSTISGPIIFVTEEMKEDYFFKKRDHWEPWIVRPELVKEIYEETGRMFTITSIEDILLENEAIPQSEPEEIVEGIVSSPTIWSNWEAFSTSPANLAGLLELGRMTQENATRMRDAMASAMPNYWSMISAAQEAMANIRPNYSQMTALTTAARNLIAATDPAIMTSFASVSESIIPHLTALSSAIQPFTTSVLRQVSIQQAWNSNTINPSDITLPDQNVSPSSAIIWPDQPIT